MPATREQADATRRKLKRASGLIRDAVQDLAAQADESDVLGEFVVSTPEDVRAVAAALDVARSQRGQMHVQIIAAPVRRTPRPR